MVPAWSSRRKVHEPIIEGTHISGWEKVGKWGGGPPCTFAPLRETLLGDFARGREMTPIAWIIAALVLLILVLRFLFKLAGWFLKLLVVAAIGLAVWWLFSGV